MQISLITTHDSNTSLASCYQRAFVELGHAVNIVIPKNYSSNIFRIRKKISTLVQSELMPNYYSKYVVEKICLHQPDITIVFQCELFSRDLINNISRSSKRVFNIWSDNPYVDWSFLADNLYSSLELYDTVFVSTKGHIPLFYQLGSKRVELLMFAYDPHIHNPVKKTGNCYDIAYFGTYGKTIAKALNGINHNIKIFGNGWDRAKGSNLFTYWQKDAGYGEHMKDEIANAKIIFNFTRQQHVTGLSMKVFEIPACGGFMISNYTDEQNEILRDGMECVYYNSFSELNGLFEFYLNNEELRESVAFNSLIRIKEHSYFNRASQLLNYEGSL